MKINRFSFASILLLAFAVFSCNKQKIETENIDCLWMEPELKQFDDVLTPQQDSLYFEIWKNEFKTAHGLDEAGFNEKVVDYRISSNNWNIGISFRVDYVVQFEWLQIRTEDQFFVWIHSSETAWPQHNLPRDTWFDANWVHYVLENEIHDPGITPINFQSSLKYTDCEDAVLAWRRKSGYNMEAHRVTFYVPGMVPRENGDPHLGGAAIIDEDDNRCAYGDFNLITGKETSHEDACIQ